VLSLAGRFGARGLRVVSVTKDGAEEDDRKHVAETAREEKMTYPCFLDVDGSWSQTAEVGGIPAFLIVGKDGRLAYRHSGKLTESSEAFEKMRAAIEMALERSVPN
jgi:hypothetical protein